MKMEMFALHGDSLTFRGIEHKFTQDANWF